jgi:hypothetical protein
MKKLILMVTLFMGLAFGAQAQTTVRNVDMDAVSKIGGNTSYDDENCTATFTGQWNRWIDLPGISGDISDTPNLQMEILKSNVILRVVLRLNAEGESKPKEVQVAAFYGQMGKPITASKLVKINLVKGSKGEVSADDLKNVVSVRISMAKAVDDAEEPWAVQFGKVSLNK